MPDTSTPDKRQPWLKFFPGDWRADPKLRTCSLAARGLWIDAIGLMHEAVPYGYLVINGHPPTVAELALQVGSSAKAVTAALAELRTNNVLSVTAEGVVFSRRMVRTAHQSAVNRANGQIGGNPNWQRGTVPKGERVGPLSAARKQKLLPQLWDECGGRCKDCGIGLTLNDPTGDAPNFAHVDHIVARRDGGTHDPANLRLLCRHCNHNRKLVDEVTDDATDEVTDEVSGRSKSSDSSQRLEARSQNPQPPPGLLVEDEIARVAAAFLAHYPAIYARCRSGAFYRVKEARDFPAAIELTRDYPPLERLEAMLEVFLRRTDTRDMGKPGSPRQFQHYAPDCDRLLRENGR